MVTRAPDAFQDIYQTKAGIQISNLHETGQSFLGGG